MEVDVRTSVVFLLGLLLGSVVAPGFAQGPRLAGDNYVNHVGIAFDDFDGALAFYTQKMGFREAFVRRDDKGQPTLAYVQVSRNTFVEIQRTNANRGPGEDSMVSNATDPAGVRIEMFQFGPKSAQGQAIATWK